MAENKEKKTPIETVIKVDDVSKVYRLYARRRDMFADAFLPGKKRYTEKRAASHVSFSVKKGECVGIIGTNGSGKSTMLKMITGVLTPTEGKIEVNGRISALLELGAGFNPEYDGIENIYLNGMMLGFTREEIDRKLQGIIDFADIGEYINQPVKTYSSGMFVRLAFALSINIEPEILIVDEALSVGDVFFQAKCYRKFEEFKEQGRTILFVSHDMSSISKYCDRVVILDKGKKIKEGPPKEMIDIYKQILVDQYEEDDKKKQVAVSKTSGIDSDELLEYGSGKAVIEEVYVTDDKGRKNSAIIKGSEYEIFMKVRFKEDCPAPVFAFSIKNVKGTEITGTNTMYEKAFLKEAKSGDEYLISFRQKMNLQGGEYLLSFGLTGFEGNDFTVYHRLYDAAKISVISDKDTVGFFDPESETKVEKL
ncbi:MAG: ABC transporter ATP-binding protein [Lachnospiraceae bacterium]|nr:ABC transporter ATP-binding protein [Lachnospiraceae bacterium]